MPQITGVQIDKMAEELAASAASPAFLELIRRVQTAPETQKLETATEVAKLDTLKEHGIPTPNGFRITTRAFEEPGSESATEISPDPNLTKEGNRFVLDFQGITTIVESVL
jgi:hypothetical protein